MSNLNAVGFHFVGGFTEAECNAYFGLLNDTRPACITVLGAGQFDQALRFAKTCKQVYPEMKVIFRHFINKANPRAMIVFEPQAEDTGRHTRMSAEMWWDHVGKLYIGTGLTVLTDNESTAEDYTRYSAWQSTVMQLAGAEGVSIAYGRFPAWHPAKSREQQMDAMLKAAFKYPIHNFSPNIYWSPDNHDAFRHPYYIIDYARKLGITLNASIGEFGLLRTPQDAHHGWRSCGIDGAAYAKQVSELAASKLPGIPVCVYSVGKWPVNADTFSIDDAFMRYIKDHPTPLVAPPRLPEQTPQIPDPPAPPPVVIPPPAPPPTPADTIAVPLDFARAEMAELAQRIADEEFTVKVRKQALAADEARLAALKARYAVYAGLVPSQEAAA